MGQVLYRKYRSKTLDEIVGQEHVTSTLRNALGSGKISHAYLLTGPRGTGKTSIARILAHEINGLPYSESTHFDIIEIDAASNNGVEDVRALREKVQTAPTSARYKVYIIDEVHMLSKAAFNALLKTLEEPPEHVIFILATTEAHKLPETIVSRTQRYSFRPVPLEKVVAHLKYIASEENIHIDDEALRLIAEHGGGSFRDSISLLDQVGTLDRIITINDIEQLLGRAPQTLIHEVLVTTSKHEVDGLTSALRQLYDSGYEPATISIQLSRQLRSQIGESDSIFTATDALKLLHELLAVPSSYNPAQLLELILLGYALQDTPAEPTTQVIAPIRSSTVPPPSPATPTQPINQPTSTEPISPSKVEPIDARPDKKLATEEAQQDASLATPVPTQPVTQKPTSPETAPPHSIVDASELWRDVLQDIKQEHNTLYGIARMAKPVLQDNTLTLSTKFPFHQKRLTESKNRDILADSVSKIRGSKTTVLCKISESANTPTDNNTTTQPDVALISNIFGGAELLD